MTVPRRGVLHEGGLLRVPGDPVGKGRPRFTRTGHAYTPPRTREFEKAVGALARVAWGAHPPLCGYVRLEVTQVEKRPKRPSPPLPSGRVWCNKGGQHPDLSNVVKAIEDALQGVAFLDDCIVVELSASKVYAARGEGPCVEVRVLELEGP